MNRAHRWAIVVGVTGMCLTAGWSRGEAEDPLIGPAPKDSLPYYRVVRVFAKLDLTEAQIKQVLEIQARTRARIARALYEERVQVIELLSDVQKIQLREVEALQKEKEREAARSARERRASEEIEEDPLPGASAP